MSTTNNTIDITPQARVQLKALEVGVHPFLRLWVAPGGCQGLTYQAAIDDQVQAGDVTVYHGDDLRVVSDAESVPHLPGLVIDWSDDLSNGGFRFANPNAKASCGCGSSFCGA